MSTQPDKVVKFSAINISDLNRTFTHEYSFYFKEYYQWQWSFFPNWNKTSGTGNNLSLISLCYRGDPMKLPEDWVMCARIKLTLLNSDTPIVIKETVHNFTKSSPGTGMFFCLKEYTFEDSCNIEVSVSFRLLNKTNEMVDLPGFRKLAIF
ncbi:uncharacterized protein [Medicago truncatula]|uniref:uncharacterized protein n=1 Tax=Medicago truncatula TaxID=3880 RepID=UPI0019673C20|nr:uncharacterized protein LOC120580231 [Medicago truncatula]